MQEIQVVLLLTIGIEDNKSTVRYEATVTLDIQGHVIERTLYVCHLVYYDIILFKSALATLRAIMEIVHNKVSTKPKCDQ